MNFTRILVVSYPVLRSFRGSTSCVVSIFNKATSAVITPVSLYLSPCRSINELNCNFFALGVDTWVIPERLFIRVTLGRYIRDIKIHVEYIIEQLEVDRAYQV